MMDDPKYPEEGETITVVWAEEVFAVAKFENYKVGPFSITSKIRPGETYETASTRMWDALNAMAQTIFLSKRNGYIERHGAKH